MNIYWHWRFILKSGCQNIKAICSFFNVQVVPKYTYCFNIKLQMMKLCGFRKVKYCSYMDKDKLRWYISVSREIYYSLVGRYIFSVIGSRRQVWYSLYVVGRIQCSGFWRKQYCHFSAWMYIGIYHTEFNAPND